MIDGVEYKINTDFRGCLLTMAAIDDPELTNQEKVGLILDNIYGEWPPDLQEALNKAAWFLSGGREPDGKEHPKYSDFEKDADMIYDAMLIRGVNLDVEKMHWWTFLSYYAELPESRFTQIVSLRYKYKKGKLDKEDRKMCDQIGWDVIAMKQKDPDLPPDEDIWKYLNGE